LTLSNAMTGAMPVIIPADDEHDHGRKALCR